MSTKTDRDVAAALARQGYSFASFEPPSGLMEKVMSGWSKYLALPTEEREKWRVGDPKDWDDGYVYRERSDDKKHFFHFRPYLFALLEHAGADYSAHIKWLEDLDALWHFSHQRFYEVLVGLDCEVPGYGFAHKFMSPAPRSKHVIRLLSYENAMTPGMQLGKPHIDRNFGTFQLHETHPALVLEFPDPVDYKPIAGHTLVFTGAKAQKLTEGKLRGVCHSVVVPKDFVPQANERPRQSAVFFAHTS
ncbi:MAG: hypothetical protein JWO73_532 [Candidatus Taylorbacteria bacterium]|nr:hypothetical protein [Candidatus Taylorbacteria bacterium]